MTTIVTDLPRHGGSFSRSPLNATCSQHRYDTIPAMLQYPGVCLVLMIAPCCVLLYLSVSAAKQPGAVRISGGIPRAGVDDDHRRLYGGMWYVKEIQLAPALENLGVKKFRLTT